MSNEDSVDLYSDLSDLRDSGETQGFLFTSDSDEGTLVDLDEDIFDEYPNAVDLVSIEEYNESTEDEGWGLADILDYWD